VRMSQVFAMVKSPVHSSQFRSRKKKQSGGLDPAALKILGVHFRQMALTALEPAFRDQARDLAIRCELLAQMIEAYGGDARHREG
jgi:hypothetical protein